MRSRTIVLGLAIAQVSASVALAAEDKKAPQPQLSYYALPRAVVDAEVKFELKACSNAVPRPDKPVDLSAYVKATAILIVRAEADPAAHYSLEPASLGNSRTKVDFGLELYESGAIKSLNATSDDRTGAIIGNILGGAFSLGRLFLGPLGFADGSQNAGSMCTVSTLEALDRVKTLKGEIAQLKTDIRKLDYGKPPAGNDGIADIKRYREKLAILQEQLKETVDNRLTLTVKKSFVPGADVAKRSILVAPSNEDLSTWFKSDAMIAQVAALDQKAAGKTLNSAEPLAVEALQVEVTVVPARSVTTPMSISMKPTPDGVVLREPVRSHVLACRSFCSLPGTQPADPLAVAAIGRAEADIPQFGDARVLPLRVKTFESRTLALTQTPFGRVQTMKWVTGSMAETASGLFKDAAGQILTGVTDLAKVGDTAELDKLKMEKNLYDAERERLEAKKKLEDLLAREE